VEIVGVNTYADDRALPSASAPDYSALAAQQIARVAEARRRRDAGAAVRALAELRRVAAEPSAPVMPSILDAVRARATVGEISDALRGIWRVYREG
jgi:methylmalonyl-CoA mutase N-terminal domain/subunit